MEGIAQLQREDREPKESSRGAGPLSPRGCKGRSVGCFGWRAFYEEYFLDLCNFLVSGTEC